ncbi:MAG TPA: hypothetical protein VMF61_01790 [Candidatus Acidoferrales bacterium]|nr:hypothetical protein [Candidatus Acidoferrales bacterium]
MADESQPLDPEQILRQRTAPAIYVVDAQARVLLSWHAPNGTAETAADPDRRLPPDIERAVLELNHALQAGAAAPLVRLLDSSYVVRVAPVAGQLGEYSAVVVERFRSRAPGKDATTRADSLRRVIGELP